MIQQTMIPVFKARHECLKASSYKGDFVIVMDIHLSQLKEICEILHRQGKKVLVHCDLIKGLKSDEYAVDYLITECHAEGIITVRSTLIEHIKKKGRLAIQRLFLIDSQSFLKSLELLHSVKPDYVEVLPGYSAKMIRRIHTQIDIPIIAGGLIDTLEEWQDALSSGAIAITTTSKELLIQLK